MKKMSVLPVILALYLRMACGQAQPASPHEAAPHSPDRLPHVKQVLVAPPELPSHEQVATGGPRVVEVRLVIEEKRIEVAPGATIWALTYNGTVPGPMIVVHKDDYVELTLVNAKGNTLVHNIDFHAATGAMGGADLTKIMPGQKVTIRFKATRAGVFIYHCAPGGMMTPLHVASGMNGAIMVLPRAGLKDAQGRPVHYDRAYYLGEQDFYLPRDKDGRFRSYDSPAQGFGDMLAVMRTLTPTHVVFNGRVDALTGDHALQASVGERVLFITSQANRDTRIHLIGGHADLVWLGGTFADRPASDYQSWAIAAGSAAAALYRFQEPGTYVYLNHNLIEGVVLGANAAINVTGPWNDDLMKQISAPRASSIQESKN